MPEIAGHYSIQMECDACHGFDVFPGANATDCRRQAREDHWRLRRNGETYCPGCIALAKREHRPLAPTPPLKGLSLEPLFENFSPGQHPPDTGETR